MRPGICTDTSGVAPLPIQMCWWVPISLNRYSAGDKERRSVRMLLAPQAGSSAAYSKGHVPSGLLCSREDPILWPALRGQINPRLSLQGILWERRAKNKGEIFRFASEKDAIGLFPPNYPQKQLVESPWSIWLVQIISWLGKASNSCLGGWKNKTKQSRVLHGINYRYR